MPTLITDNDTMSNGPILAVLNESFQTVTESKDPLHADWLSQSDKVGFLLLLSVICFVAFFGEGGIYFLPTSVICHIVELFMSCPFL